MIERISSTEDLVNAWNTIISLLSDPKYKTLWQKAIQTSPTKSAWKIHEIVIDNHVIIKKITIRIRDRKDVVVTFMGNDKDWLKPTKRTFVFPTSMIDAWKKIILWRKR